MYREGSTYMKRLIAILIAAMFAGATLNVVAQTPAPGAPMDKKAEKTEKKAEKSEKKAEKKAKKAEKKAAKKAEEKKS